MKQSPFDGDIIKVNPSLKIVTQTTEVNTRELKDLITGLREEMRVGFANIDIKFANVDTKLAKLDGKIDTLEANIDTKLAALDGKINTLEANIDTKFANVDTKIATLDGKIDTLDVKFEERTRLGFWGFVFRAIVISVLSGIALLFVRYLFPELVKP